MEKSTYYFLSVSLLAIMVFLSACNNSDNARENDTGSDIGESPPDKQVLNLTAGSEIPTGDPTLAIDENSFVVFGQTMEGLYTLNKDDKPIPAIAEGDPEINDDETEYTFHLREDAEWSNGDPVTADDFVYSWQRAVDPDTGSQYVYIFDGIIENAGDIINGKKDPDELGVEAEDDYTLKVTLEQPVEYLNSLLAFATYLPLNREFVEEQGDDFGTNSDSMLSNGPFELKEWDGSGMNWKYVKNDHYYDKDNVSLDTVNVQVVKETSTAVNLYETEELDRAGLSAEYARQYKNDDDVTSFKEGFSWYLKFNQERDGEDTALANKNIRKAIAMAFNKENFTEEVLANGSVPIDGYVPEGVAENPETGEDFRDESGSLMSYDPEKAKEYWEKGLDELGVDGLELEYLTEDVETSKRQAEYFQNQLEENLDGLKLDLRTEPFKVRMQHTAKQDYDIVMHGWGPDYLDPMTFLELYVTDGTNNETGYSNDKYDQLIDEAKRKYADNPEKRWKKMLEAEKVLVEEDTVIAPIFQRAHMTLIQPYVKNFEEHLFGPNYSLKNVTIEK